MLETDLAFGGQVVAFSVGQGHVGIDRASFKQLVQVLDQFLELGRSGGLVGDLVFFVDVPGILLVGRAFGQGDAKRRSQRSDFVEVLRQVQSPGVSNAVAIGVVLREGDSNLLEVFQGLGNFQVQGVQPVLTDHEQGEHFAQTRGEAQQRVVLFHIQSGLLDLRIVLHQQVIDGGSVLLDHGQRHFAGQFLIKNGGQVLGGDQEMIGDVVVVSKNGQHLFVFVGNGVDRVDGAVEDFVQLLDNVGVVAGQGAAGSVAEVSELDVVFIRSHRGNAGQQHHDSQQDAKGLLHIGSSFLI